MRLIEAIEELKRKLEIPATIREALGEKEREFYDRLEAMAEQAFDDQCTGANPRYPLIQDMKELYVLAYRGCRVDSALYHQPEPVLA